MSEVQRTKSVKAGGWKTLESGWNASFHCRFFLPTGAQIKVRYGTGWPLGWDSQQQTLDGQSPKILKVGGPVYARVQMKLARTTEVTYTYITVGP